MIQIITKNNKVLCKTTVPYSPQTIREMKRADYKVKELMESPDNLKEKDKNDA